MNLHHIHHHNHASVLLLMIVGTFVAIVGGMAVYNLVKAAKRVDGGSYRNGLFTNDESIVVPNDKYDTNMVCFWRDVTLSLQWDDTIPTGSGLIGAAAVPSAASNPMQPGPVVLSSLNATGGVVIQISLDGTDLVRTTTYRELGMPVDVDGMPEDADWSIGQAPDGPSQDWNLERSDDLVNWARVMAMQMRPGQTNAFRDQPLQGGQTYYRASRP